MTRAYKELGIEIKIISYSGERALATSNKGKADGELFRNDQVAIHYTNLLMVPIPIARVDLVAFTKNKQFTVNGWSSLKPFLIGVELGFKRLENKTQGMNIQTATRVEQLFKMLDLGRVDVVPQVRMDGLNVLKQLNIKGVKVLEPPLFKGSVYHYLHKRHEALLPRLAAVLKQMEESEELKKIKENMILKLK
ncbi:MAG: transporter substrate-binding domain-containing protein [Bermanella sp.]